MSASPNELQRPNKGPGRRAGASADAGDVVEEAPGHRVLAGILLLEEDLGEGALWFNLNAYVDGSYTWVEARIIALEENLLELTPAGDRHMQFTLTYEVRELPRAADEAYFAALVGGADQLAAMISELDLAVNTDLKAAAT